ncbi:MAG: protein kinase [Planctomycetaceae bacterium]|nr:protein kinase [Planctomycetaceae bacterium]
MSETCLSDDVLRNYGLGLIDAEQIDRIADHLLGCAACSQRFQAYDEDADPLLNLLREDVGKSMPSVNVDRFIDNLSSRTQKIDARPEANLSFECPHCCNPIQVKCSPDADEITCPVCESTIAIERDRHSEQFTAGKKLLGRFELRDVVGRGGFGTVYRAVDLELGRTVAIKVPRSGRILTEEDEERFVREARASARLNHPNIIPIFEVSNDGIVPYIVAEYVEGETLAAALRRRRFTFRETAQIVSQLAQALSHSHLNGIIHRDLTPANVMLEECDGRELKPRIMDFGLARQTEGEVTLTADGCLMGTPAYAPPEQLGSDEHKVDTRSDIYSLGVILYEMLTGELPFRGSLRVLIDQVHKFDPRSPRKINDRIPRDLETICLKCLEKVPSKRYQDAETLEDDLNRWLAGVPISARRVASAERAWRWCARNPVVSALVVLIVLSLIAGITTTSLFAYRASQKALSEFQSRKQATKALENEQRARAAETNAREAERIARLQAERRKDDATAALYTSNLIALAAHYRERDWGRMRLKLDEMSRDPDQRKLLNWEWSYLDDLCRRRMRLLKLPNLNKVKFNPDGARLAVVQPPNVIIVDPSTLEVTHTLACDATSDSDIAWSPDGTRLAVGGKLISIWNPETGESVAVFRESQDERISCYAIDWNPDATQIVSGSKSAVGLLDIWDVETARKSARLLDGTPADVMTDVAWRPDGQVIVSLHVGNPELPRGEEKKANTVGGQRPGGFYSRPGSRALEWNMSASDPSKEPKERRKGGFGYFQGLDWASDESSVQKLLLYGDGLEIWGGHPLNVPDLTRLGAITAGAWNKENSLVALGNSRNEIVLLDVNTGNPIESFHVHGARVRGVDWNDAGQLVSTSANWLAVLDQSLDPNPEIELMMFHLDTHIHSQTWSPDSRHIAIESNNNRYIHQVALWNVFDSDVLRRTDIRAKNISLEIVTEKEQFLRRDTGSWDIGQLLCWSPDGQWIASSRTGRDIAVRSVENLKDENRVKWQIDRNDGNHKLRGRLIWSQDGTTIAVLTGTGQLLVVDAGSGAILWDSKVDGSHVNSLSFSPVDQSLTFATGDKLFVKSAQNRQEELFLESAMGDIFAVDWSPTGDRLIVASSDGLAIYDAHTRKMAIAIDPAASSPTSCSWHPDAERIAVGTSGGGVLIVDASTGKILLTLARHQSRVLHLDWSPDGKRLLSSTEDRAFLWGTLEIRWPIPVDVGTEAKTSIPEYVSIRQSVLGDAEESFGQSHHDGSSVDTPLHETATPKKVLAFNGDGQIEIEWPSDTEMLRLPDAFTVEFWVESQASQTGHVFRSEHGEAVILGVRNNKYEFGVITNQREGSSGWTQTWATQSGFTDAGGPAHVAGCWNGKEASLFINGVRQKPCTVSRHWGSMDRTQVDTNNSPKLTWDRYGWRLSNTTKIAPLFRGYIWSMRLSSGVKYEDRFDPPEKLSVDENTLLYFTIDDATRNPLKSIVFEGASGKQILGSVTKATLVTYTDRKNKGRRADDAKRNQPH